MGHIDGYLELCLRVRVDSCDPSPVLARLASRANVPRGLKRNLVAWQGSVAELAKRRPLSPGLSEIRRLLSQAGDRKAFPDERSAIVLYFTASGLGNRFIEKGDPSLAELSEAYYWLGFVETRVGRSFWPSEGEYFLEASIRVAPGTERALEAYALLEELVAIGYTGNGDAAPPQDVQRWLEELRRVNVDAGRLSAPTPDKP